MDFKVSNSYASKVAFGTKYPTRQVLKAALASYSSNFLNGEDAKSIGLICTTTTGRSADFDKLFVASVDFLSTVKEKLPVFKVVEKEAKSFYHSLTKAMTPYRHHKAAKQEKRLFNKLVAVVEASNDGTKIPTKKEIAAARLKLFLHPQYIPEINVPDAPRLLTEKELVETRKSHSARDYVNARNEEAKQFRAAAHLKK